MLPYLCFPYMFYAFISQPKQAQGNRKSLMRGLNGKGEHLLRYSLSLFFSQCIGILGLFQH